MPALQVILLITISVFIVSCGVGQTNITEERTNAESKTDNTNGTGVKITSELVADSSLSLPPVPADTPDLVGFSGTEWNHEQLPPLRFSADGRVAVAAKSGRAQIKFHLMAPERMQKPFGTTNGVNILQQEANGDIHQKIFRLDNAENQENPADLHPAALPKLAPGFTTEHFSVCDVKQTPRVCDGMDCYDLVVIASLMPEEGQVSASQAKQRMLASFPLTVRVSDPKTANAKIANVMFTAGKTAKISARPLTVRALFEPLTAGDGRLLLARIAQSDLAWTDSRGKVGQGNYDVVYSWYAGGDPCDASKWVELLPITHAPYDYDVRTRYDFARQPFRDGQGKVIPDGAEIGISYPWIDREAKLLVFTTNGATLFKQSGSELSARYPVRCANTECNAIPTLAELPNIEEGRGLSRGFAIMGAWTQGRMILMDNMLNRADFGLATDPSAIREVGLYKDSAGMVQFIKVGANRDNTAIPGLKGYVGNTTFFESITDRFAFSDKFAQRLARDVTWTVANGVMTDELSFDEFLDRDTILFADMNAVVGLFDNAPTIQYRNGESSPPLLQNTATGGPSFGELSGKARIEPVALGGRFGKGVYLQRRDTMSFAFDAAVQSDTWYVSTFLKPDTRFNGELLFTFPDGGSVRVSGDELIISVARANGVFAQRPVYLPARTLLPDVWVHIGLLSEKLPDGTFALTSYINGMAMSYSVFINQPIEFGAGKFVVGGGVAGWFDEVRIAKALPDVEELCNYAYGTLAQLEANVDASNHWAKLSALYPAFAHAQIQTSLKRAGENTAGGNNRFICLINHRSRYGWAPSQPLPRGVSRYLRSTLLMGGQSFRAALPRPEARYNQFCQSCHFENNQVPGLKLAGPLMRIELPMQDDDRKQPTQPRRIWSGITPAGALGNNEERSDKFSIYMYLFP